MTQEWRSLKAPTAFVHTKFSGFQDLGLISQVELWSITRSVFEQFGADVESQAAIQRPMELLGLAQAYDQWLQTWRSMLVFDSHDHRGGILELYYHSSKLYLDSHIYRGKAEPVATIESSVVDELRNNFRESAVSVLRIMLDQKMRLLDLPSYFSTMLAFATVALVKMVREGDVARTCSKPEILRLLQQLAETLRANQLPHSPPHPLLGISKGLERATESLQSDASDPLPDATDMNFDESIFMEDIWNMDFTDLGDTWMGFGDH